MGVEPARDAGHHRHDDGRRACAHKKPEDELEHKKRRSPEGRPRRRSPIGSEIRSYCQTYQLVGILVKGVAIVAATAGRGRTRSAIASIGASLRRRDFVMRQMWAHRIEHAVAADQAV